MKGSGEATIRIFEWGVIAIREQDSISIGIRFDGAGSAAETDRLGWPQGYSERIQ